MNHGPLVTLIEKAAEKTGRTFGDQLMHLAQLGLQYEKLNEKKDHIRIGRKTK